MTDFRTPIEDITFALRHVADLDSLAKLDGYEHADPELIDGLVAEAGRFFDEVVAPTNRDGDTVGTKLNADGSITSRRRKYHDGKSFQSFYAIAYWPRFPAPSTTTSVRAFY